LNVALGAMANPEGFAVSARVPLSASRAVHPRTRVQPSALPLVARDKNRPQVPPVDPPETWRPASRTKGREEYG
jgi:hypothetical protein